jgi:hypothetical protein
MKYKVIRENNAAEFENALKSALSFGWVPMAAPTVNSQTNQWLVILYRNNE